MSALAWLIVVGCTAADPASVEAQQPEETLEETFVLGPETPAPLLDILFVVDDSTSVPTEAALTRMALALQPASAPAKIRVAVTHEVPPTLTAVRQHLERAPRFRPGAAVALVFVSSANRLEPAPVSFDDLEVAAERHHPLASFTVGAAVPFTGCTDASQLDVGRTAFEPLIRSGRGTVMNLCDATPAQWRAFLGTLTTQGATVRHPVLALSAPAMRVLSVRRDGVDLSYRTTPDGQVVVLEEMPTDRADIVVRYRKG